MSGVRLTKVGVGNEADTSVLVNTDGFLWAEDKPRQNRNSVGWNSTTSTTTQGQRMTLLIFAGTTNTLSVAESVDEVEHAIFGADQADKMQAPKIGVKETRDAPKMGVKETRTRA